MRHGALTRRSCAISLLQYRPIVLRLRSRKAIGRNVLTLRGRGCVCTCKSETQIYRGIPSFYTISRPNSVNYAPFKTCSQIIGCVEELLAAGTLRPLRSNSPNGCTKPTKTAQPTGPTGNSTRRPRRIHEWSIMLKRWRVLIFNTRLRSEKCWLWLC